MSVKNKDKQKVRFPEQKIVLTMLKYLNWQLLKQFSANMENCVRKVTQKFTFL